MSPRVVPSARQPEAKPMSKRRALLGSLLSAGFLVLSAPTLWADDVSGVEAEQKGSEFLKQYGNVKADLKTILDDAKQLQDNVKSLRDPKGTLKDFEEFRATVSDTLAALADSGSITTESQSYLAYIAGELQKTKNRQTTLTDAETKTLVTTWQNYLDSATQKVAVIDKLRGQLIEMLITLQGKEYYIEQLIKTENAKVVLDNLDAIIADFGKTIDDLKDIQGKLPNS